VSFLVKVQIFNWLVSGTVKYQTILQSDLLLGKRELKKPLKTTPEAVVGAIDVLRNQADSATLTAHRLIKTGPTQNAFTIT
jgi:hypothetical protein